MGFLKKEKSMKKTIGMTLTIVGLIFFFLSGGIGLIFSLISSFSLGAIFVPEFEEQDISATKVLAQKPFSWAGCPDKTSYLRIVATIKSKNEMEIPPQHNVILPLKVYWRGYVNYCGQGWEEDVEQWQYMWNSPRSAENSAARETLEQAKNDKVLEVFINGKEIENDSIVRARNILIGHFVGEWGESATSVNINIESNWKGINEYEIRYMGKAVLKGVFYKEPDECTIPPGYALVTEDFKAGTTISRDSFARPVVAFCNSYPIMKMDSSGKTLNEYSTKELELLRDGSYVTVPSGEVWKIMYVAKISDLTKACKPGEYVDENGNCIPLPAFEYYCSSGTYDPDKHACLVQPVTRCIEGSYNEATGMCEKIISPEEVIIKCPEDSELKVLDDGTKVCVFEPVPYCEKGVLSQDELGREICAYFPEIVNLAEGQRNIEIGEIPDELHVRTYTCPLIDGRMIFIETFAGGKEVNKYSFRYPVNFFCKVHPVIITTADGRTYKRAEIYDRIVAGETLTIPEDETWTFFYVGYANQQLPLVCKEGALRVSEDKIECVVQPGIVHVCSEGQFDPVKGLCVIQPESKAVCESGYYDAEKKVCIWHPPLQAVCEKGLYNPDTKLCEWKPQVIVECEKGTYDASRGVCVFTPTTLIQCQRGEYDEVAGVCKYSPGEEIVCESPFIYNPQTQMCEWEPETIIKCEEPYIYNPQTKLCEWKPAKVVECEGVYDEERGVCTIIPVTVIRCQRGYYDEAADICRYTPQEEIVCKEPYIYNPQTNKCEYKPPEDVVCEKGEYNPITRLCEWKPLVEAQCEKGTYDKERGVCIFTPTVRIVCEMGVWNEQTQACEYAGEINYVCEEGTFDRATKTCIVKPPIYYKCEKGTYNKDRGVCEYTPIAEAQCERGKYDPSTDKCIFIPREYVVCEGTYDEETGKCIVKMIPEYECEGEIIDGKCVVEMTPEYVCDGVIVGDKCVKELKTEYDCKGEIVGNVCIIQPETKVICPGKSHWDEEQKACILEGEVKIVCPEGAELVDGECVSRKAMVISYDSMQIVSGLMVIAGVVLWLL